MRSTRTLLLTFAAIFLLIAAAVSSTEAAKRTHKKRAHRNSLLHHNQQSSSSSSTPELPEGSILFVSFHGGKKETKVNDVYQYDYKGNYIGSAIDNQHLPQNVTIKETRGIAFGPDGNFYVLNGYNNYSQILVFQGTPSTPDTPRPFIKALTSWDPVTNPCIRHPFGIDFSKDGNVYVTSQDTNLVCRYYLNGGDEGAPMPLPSDLAPPHYPPNTFVPGTFAASSDIVGDGVGLIEVRALRFGPIDGILYVADEKGDRIRRYDTTTGEALSDITDKHMSKPVHMLFSQDGTKLYIATKTSAEILVYDTETQEVSRFISKDDNGGLAEPAGMSWAGGDGHLYVASRANKNILRFHLTSGKSEVFMSDLPDEPEFIYIATPADLKRIEEAAAAANRR